MVRRRVSRQGPQRAADRVAGRHALRGPRTLARSAHAPRRITPDRHREREPRNPSALRHAPPTGRCAERGHSHRRSDGARVGGGIAAEAAEVTKINLSPILVHMSSWTLFRIARNSLTLFGKPPCGFI